MKFSWLFLVKLNKQTIQKADWVMVIDSPWIFQSAKSIFIFIF